MRVLIADDHPMIRDALQRTIHAAEPFAEFAGAKDFSEVTVSAATHTDLLLLDFHMPGMSIDGVRQLRAEHPKMKILIVSGENDPALMRRLLTLGVAGFLPKAEPPDVLIQAIKLVIAGGTYTPVQALGDLYEPTPCSKTSHLTARQMDVLKLLTHGEPNKIIAKELGLTEGTVKLHIAAILRALKCRNRTEAVLAARELGIGP